MSTMVDSKLAKSVQKSVGRAKEKILQNLGKVDRTADEIFDDHVSNFNKQQYSATRLQKELNNYIRCIRACAGASRALLEAVNEVYEPEWGGKELLNVNSQSVEMLWNDFAHRLAEQVLIPLNTYQAQFPETRKKIEKRCRKLIDFDGERHALQALQSNPRRAEAKLNKQRENLESAKRTYEVLNSELHEELPSLFGSRIVFLVSAMSTLFSSEVIFHSETSKVFTELDGIVERLAKESAKGNLSSFKMPSNAILNSLNRSDSPKDGVHTGNSSGSTPTVNNANNKILSANNAKNSSSNSHSSPREYNNANGQIKEHCSNGSSNGDMMMANPKILANGGGGGGNAEMAGGVAAEEHSPLLRKPQTQMDGGMKKDDEKRMSNSNNDVVDGKMNNMNEVVSSASAGDNKTIMKADEGISSVQQPAMLSSSNNSTEEMHSSLNNNKPVIVDSSKEVEAAEKTEPGVLYRVRATYRYQKEDVDELSFDAGEVIKVIEYDDPEEQEEGWLMGMKDNGEKGLFPSNFTRPI